MTVKKRSHDAITIPHKSGHNKNGDNSTTSRGGKKVKRDGKSAVHLHLGGGANAKSADVQPSLFPFGQDYVKCMNRNTAGGRVSTLQPKLVGTYSWNDILIDFMKPLMVIIFTHI